MSAQLNTYNTMAEAEADRAQQKALLTALNGWGRALRLDECGAWRINGACGSIHTWGDGKGWVLSVQRRSERQWTYTKRRLAFCTVTQDGDDEGCLRLHQLPTAEQADVIRDVLGIRKRVEFGAEELERRRALMKRLVHEQGLANAIGEASEPLEEEAAILGADPPRELEEASTEQPALDDAIPS